MIDLKKVFFLLFCVFLSFSVFAASFFQKTTVFTSSIKNVTDNSIPVIIIDAGHGGFDGGASTNDGTPEKEINLAVSLYLNSFLTSFGYRTTLTRTKDESLESEGLDTIKSKKTSDIHNRMSIMENIENAVFISIHQNHFSEEKYKGTQVFYSPNFSDESSLLAQEIQNTVVSQLQPDNHREIKKCGSSVYLMFNAVKPSVLVECGFLSNTEEANKLKMENYQKKIAFCIAMGIQSYLSSRVVS